MAAKANSRLSGTSPKAAATSAVLTDGRRRSTGANALARVVDALGREVDVNGLAAAESRAKDDCRNSSVASFIVVMEATRQT